MRVDTHLVHSIRASTIFFQLCTYLGDIPKKFGTSRRSGTLSSSTTFNSRYAKIPKIQNFEIGFWLVWGRDIDPRWSPGCRGMVSAPQDRFPDVQPVKTCTTHFFGKLHFTSSKSEGSVGETSEKYHERLLTIIGSLFKNAR